MALLVARRALYALACAALVFVVVRWVFGAPWALAAVLALLAAPFTFFNRTQYGHDLSSNRVHASSSSSSADGGSSD